jgi:hypothetical protein
LTLQELQQQVLDLPTGDRWFMLKLIVESLQPEVIKENHNDDLGWNPRFFERTAGLWQGEPLERGDQGKCDQRNWSEL